MPDQTIQTALSAGVPSLAVLVGIQITAGCQTWDFIADLRNTTDGRFDDAGRVQEANLRRVDAANVLFFPPRNQRALVFALARWNVGNTTSR